MRMQSLAWDDRFITGLESIDDQHRGLVARVNAFGAHLAGHAEVPAEEVGALLDAVVEYAARHFADELALQREVGLDPRFLALHEAEHARFAADVQQRRAASLTDAQAARGLLAFLVGWLASHILGTDQLAARQIALVRAGATPAEAFARAELEDDAGTGLLTGLVDDLLAVVSARNRALESANASLEERVEAKAAQLEATFAQLRQTQQRLFDAAKLASVGQLASGVAHELNSPLGSVLSNLGTLGAALEDVFGLLDVYRSAEPGLAPPLRATLQGPRGARDLDFLKQDLPELIAESQQDLRRASAVVRELKQFARVDEPTTQHLDLDRAVGSALALLPAELKAVARFELAPGEVPPVQAHGAAINHALLALLTNAAQAVRDRPRGRADSPRVTVRTGAVGSRAFVDIADNGVGMTPEVLAHLFEPFFTTRPAGEGVGLGLSAAWGAAQREGGDIDVVSMPGEGSTFRLWLPLAPEDAPGKLACPAPNPFNLRKLRGPGAGVRNH